MKVVQLNQRCSTTCYSLNLDPDVKLFFLKYFSNLHLEIYQENFHPKLLYGEEIGFA